MAESIITAVLEVVRCLAPPVQRRISFLFRYKKYIENLQHEIEKTKVVRAPIQHKVEEAKRNGQNIVDCVNEWLESISNAIAEAEKLVVSHEATANNRCFKMMFKAHFQLSKDAVRHSETLSKRRETGSFDIISYPSIPEDIRLLPSKDYEAFASRASMLGDIIGALKDPNANMIGIFGMAGVGKTTLVKEVGRQVKSEYDRVIFVEVSQIPDIRKMQDRIAANIGLKFEEKNESERADSLYSRLKNEKKILFILDNIWESLNLQAVGIPYGDDYKGFKVLMTARSEDVLLRKMDSQRNFEVGVLKEEEAWSLFKKMAGDYIEDGEFKSVATEVANECAGLPISIVTVARALRRRDFFEWEDALQQLRRPACKDFQNIQPGAYSAIVLSYNMLQGEQLKKIFLLIAYSYVQTVDELLMCGMGLGLFGVNNNMKDARVRARLSVRKLRESCMLLDHTKNENYSEWFSIHDTVRDVAISIAYSEHNVLTVTNDELVSRQCESSDAELVSHECPYTSIVLRDIKTNGLPQGLECPNLELLFMRAEEYSNLRLFGLLGVLLMQADEELTIPENFFAKMNKVRVVFLSDLPLLPFPSSLALLTNLRTLCLYYCVLQDINFVGKFKKLESLCLESCQIEQLSEEMSQLTRLKYLDTRRCLPLKVIPPNVLSKLSCLEELYIFEIKPWGMEVEGLRNANLDELKHLPNLISLDLHIEDVNTLPSGLFFDKLERFYVCVGENKGWSRNKEIVNTFHLELNTNICLKDGLIVPLKKVEYLNLSGLQHQDVKSLAHEFLIAGTLQLKELVIKGCDAPNSEQIQEESTNATQSNEISIDDDSLFFEKVTILNLESISMRSINVERIWQNAAVSCGVQSLTSLKVYGCRNLKCLFSSSTLTSCVRLKTLEIVKCPLLEELIIVDQTETKNFIFPQLQWLGMRDLKNLKRFCSGDGQVEFPLLQELRISECPKFSNYKFV